MVTVRNVYLAFVSMITLCFFMLVAVGAESAIHEIEALFLLLISTVSLIGIKPK